MNPIRKALFLLDSCGGESHMHNKFKLTLSVDYDSYRDKPRGFEGKITNHIKKNPPLTLSVEQLAQLIQQGSTFIGGRVLDHSAKFTNDNVSDMSLITLDIDNKDTDISPREAILHIEKMIGIRYAIYYDSFSSSNEKRKYRLVYVLDKPIDRKMYEEIYKRLLLLFPFCDNSTKDVKRLWYGTKHPVFLSKELQLVNGDLLLQKLKDLVQLDRHENPKRRTDVNYTNLTTDNENLYKYIEFKKDVETRELISRYIKANVSITDYITFLTGLDLDNEQQEIRLACPFHGGDNPTGFAIYNHTQTVQCYTKKCVCGDVITLCQIAENLNFFQAVKRLMSIFNLRMPRSFIVGGVTNHAKE